MRISGRQAALTAIKTAMTGKTTAAAKAKKSEPIATLKKTAPVDVSRVFSRKVGGLTTNPGQIKMMYGVPTKPAGKLPGLVLRYGLLPQSPTTRPTEPVLIMKYGISLTHGPKD